MFWSGVTTLVAKSSTKRSSSGTASPTPGKFRESHQWHNLGVKPSPYPAWQARMDESRMISPFCKEGEHRPCGEGRLRERSERSRGGGPDGQRSAVRNAVRKNFVGTPTPAASRPTLPTRGRASKSPAE